jgi:hypothetical protein
MGDEHGCPEGEEAAWVAGQSCGVVQESAPDE